MATLHVRARPERIRDVLAVALAVASGATDALGFVRLGGVFSSVMTGNLVLLGVSAGKGDRSLALHAGAALGGYVVGAWVGARVAGHPASGESVWPRSVTTALAVELGLFAVFAAWWVASGGQPLGGAGYALNGVSAGALGIQSSAVLGLGIPGISTTYGTGMLTQLVASIASRRARFPTRSLVVLGGMLAGALVGAVLTFDVPRAAAALPLGGVAVVLLVAAVGFRGSAVVR